VQAKLGWRTDPFRRPSRGRARPEGFRWLCRSPSTSRSPSHVSPRCSNRSGSPEDQRCRRRGGGFPEEWSSAIVGHLATNSGSRPPHTLPGWRAQRETEVRHLRSHGSWATWYDRPTRRLLMEHPDCSTMMNILRESARASPVPGVRTVGSWVSVGSCVYGHPGGNLL
jgi:hypothetical protein